MRSKNKSSTAITAKPPLPVVALSPRQVSLQKLYRVLQVGGAIAVAVTLVVMSVIYRDNLFGSGSKIASAREFEFREPKLNANTPPGPAPEGMVWIPGGEFYMGCEELDQHSLPVFPDAQDIHLVYVDGFWMDKSEVTNEQFRKFVEATGHVTVAEKRPDPKDFPKPQAEDMQRFLENLRPFSTVFRRPGPYDKVDINDHRNWWSVCYGASWKHPEGPGSTISGREKHPVVHISYTDALAYCQWAKKRLPTEAEWEFAARGGLNRKLYPWGDELKPDDKWMANTWQGRFPVENTKEDGYETTSPVGSFPANGYGLHDVAGNVWEWCADWYQPNHYFKQADADPLKAVRNPQGPLSGFDHKEEGVPKRVQRGGSFLCAENYCVRYIVGSRHCGEPTSSGNHVGFRCVMAAK